MAVLHNMTTFFPPPAQRLMNALEIQSSMTTRTWRSVCKFELFQLQSRHDTLQAHTGSNRSGGILLIYVVVDLLHGVNTLANGGSF